MQARTYQAPNMLTALERIQEELGPEALIVSVRQIPGGAAWEVWKKPAVEVVAMPPATLKGTAAQTRSLPATSRVTPRALPTAAPSFDDAEQRVLARLRTTSTVARGSRNADLAEAPTAPIRPPETATASGLAALAGAVKTALHARRTIPARNAVDEPLGVQLGAVEIDEPEAPEALPVPVPEEAWSPAVADLYATLLDQGVAADLARPHFEAASESLSARALLDPDQVQAFVGQRLAARLIAPAPSPNLASGVVCLVGTPGAGKTTAAAKLAHLAARRLGLRAAWVCADTYRAGAIMQARMYAEALRLPLRVAYTPDELAQAVAAEQDADLVIVDLPGVNVRRQPQLHELSDLLAALPGRLTYLTSPATAKDADLQSAFAALNVFDLKGLVLTKLDETGTIGGVYNLALRSQLPLLYYSAGPRVLDEFHPAQPTRLVNALFEGGW